MNNDHSIGKIGQVAKHFSYKYGKHQAYLSQGQFEDSEYVASHTRRSENHLEAVLRVPAGGKGSQSVFGVHSFVLLAFFAVASFFFAVCLVASFGERWQNIQAMRLWSWH